MDKELSVVESTNPIKDEKGKSFIDIMYERIEEVIGGSNENQFFCMTVPGMLVVPEMYTYDYKNHESKPPAVEANESKLANKLFDACEVCASDNGMTLPQQFQTAINMLTPKLNAKIAEAKNTLREMLMSPYSYDFGNGLEKDLTLQQVFFRLYDEWIERKQVWSKMQSSKKEELAKKYPNDDAESNIKYENEYLTWYQDIAEGYLQGLNEQMGKILAVFSPNDMKIIEGILSSGSGAELEEAREILINARKSNPSGGYTYPVSFYPENWFELLDNSFSGIDLLQSPAILSEEMSVLVNQRINLIAQVNRINESVPKNDEINAAKAELDAAQKKLDEAGANLTKSYGQGAAAVFKAALAIAGQFGGAGVTASVISRLSSISGVKNDANFGKALLDSINSNMDAQTELVNAAHNLTAAQLKVIELKGLSELKSLLTPLQTKLQSVETQINELQAKIQLAQALAAKESEQTKEGVSPNTVPKGFTQIVIETSASSMKTATSKSASASSSSSGCSFFFGGYSKKSSSSQSAFDSFTQDDSCKIQIGMSVAKVSVQRDWFNPGLFKLSGNMCNVTTQKFAPAQVFSDGFDAKRFAEMNKTIFSCYPTSFVIARDVTFRLLTSHNFSDEHTRAMEQHSSSGGGFLFFSGSSSSSSSSSSASASVISDSKSITVRFKDPQIMGYYLEATPADKSVYIDNVNNDKEAGYVTVMDFVKKCKIMLNESRTRMLEGR